MLTAGKRIIGIGNMLSPPMRAAAYMLSACVVWSFMTWIVCYLSTDLHAFEIVFFRNLFGFIAIAPFLFRHGIPAFPPRNFRSMWCGPASVWLR